MKKFLIGFALALAVALSIPAIAQMAPPNGANSWSVYHTPAAATVATISVAANNTLRHVATSVTVCIGAVANQAPIQFVLRDGATGAGTILWATRVGGLANTSNCVHAPGYWRGSNNVAMTVESSSAPAATNFATVSVSGYDDRY